jgi:hypothetical protein
VAQAGDSGSAAVKARDHAGREQALLSLFPGVIPSRLALPQRQAHDHAKGEIDMANILRIIGAIGICAGLTFLAVTLAPLVRGEPLALTGPFLITQAAVAISAGIIALGLGQLIAVSQDMAESMASLLDHMRSRDVEEDAPAAEPERDVFANVPNYSPRRDPPIVREGTYLSHTVLTLEDGTVAIQTPSGWKRFQRIRDFDRLLRA